MSTGGAGRRWRLDPPWRALWWGALAGFAVLAWMPAPPDPVAVRHADKLYHCGGYALLALYTVQLWRGRALASRLLALLLLGLALEGMQALLPWRSADPVDAVANALGVLLGAAALWTPARHLLAPRHDTGPPLRRDRCPPLRPL